MKIASILILAFMWWGTPATTHALTAEEILLLKQNGVSEATIQMMLQSEMQARADDAAARDAMGVKTITRPGGQPAIVYSTGRGDNAYRDAEASLQEERAWEMLRNLIVDTRTTND